MSCVYACAYMQGRGQPQLLFLSSHPLGFWRAMPAWTGTADFLPHPEPVWGCLQTFLFLSLKCSPEWVSWKANITGSFSPGIHRLCVPRPEPCWDCCAAQDTSGGSSMMGQWNQSSFLGNTRWQVEGGRNVSKAVLLSRSLFQTSHNWSHPWRQAPPSLCITSFISVCQHLFSHVAWFVSSDPCLVPETATQSHMEPVWRSLLGGEIPGF